MARALFGEGRQLVEGGQYAAACPKFEAASRLFASAGVLVNLGDCYERLGRTASAAAAFGRAAEVASRTNRLEDAAEAKRRKAALEPHLAHVSIRVADSASGLTVTRDGAPVPASSWGVAIPVDPGAHEIRAQAPGYDSWALAITSSPDGGTTTVDVPALRPAPPVVAPLPTLVVPGVAPTARALFPKPLPRGPAGATAALPAPVCAEECRSDGNPRHQWGWVDGAFGFGYSTVASLNSSNLAAQNTSGGGPTGAVGVGLRLSFLSLGVRARAVSLVNLSVWELDVESAFHVQVGEAEVYLGLRGGYAAGNVSTDGNNGSVDGFNMGTMLGFDSYLTSFLSWGFEANPELVDLQRPPLALPAGTTLSMLTPDQQALYQASGLNVGLVFVGSAHARLHF